MLARCGGGDPGKMIIGWRFLVGLGCSTVSVGITRSLGRACFSSGEGGSMSMVMAGVCMGAAAAMAGVKLSFGILQPMPTTGLFKFAIDVVVVSVGVVSTSESIRRFDFSRCSPILSFSFERKDRKPIDYQ